MARWNQTAPQAFLGVRMFQGPPSPGDPHTVILSFLDGFTHGMTRQYRATPLDAFFGVWMLRGPPRDPHKVQFHHSLHTGVILYDNKNV